MLIVSFSENCEKISVFLISRKQLKGDRSIQKTKYVEQLYRTDILVDSRSTSILRVNIETFVGCEPTIRFDCNLIDQVLTCKPLSYPVHVIE